MSYTPANPNGQATMAASAPVVLASDEVVPVQVGMIEELMSALLNRLGPIGLAIDPPSGRLRVLIDPVGGAQSLPVTLASLATVTTVSTVNAVTGITNVGGNSAVYDQLAQMQSMVTPLRPGIVVS